MKLYEVKVRKTDGDYFYCLVFAKNEKEAQNKTERNLLSDAKKIEYTAELVSEHEIEPEGDNVIYIFEKDRCIIL